MPLEIIYAFAPKRAAISLTASVVYLMKKKATLISQACAEILAGNHDDQFPLVIWQTGSGTQSNMNVNEVVANRCHILSGGN